MLGDETAAEMRIIEAAKAVVEAARVDLSAEGIPSIARVPAQLTARLADALNMLNRASLKAMSGNREIIEAAVDNDRAAGFLEDSPHYQLGMQDATIKRLREALTNLSNEVLGTLPLMEQLCRREFGNTNYAIMIQRAEEARRIGLGVR